MVDSGGTGSGLVVRRAVRVVAGDPLPVAPPVESITVHVHEQPEHHARRHRRPALRGDVPARRGRPTDGRAFKEVWSGIGDSIVIVGGDGLYNCHIHTDDIGAAIEAALDAGRPREIRVTDLSEQVIEERWVREATAVDTDEDAAGRRPRPRWSRSSWATGSGGSFARSGSARSSRAVSR